MSKSPTGKRSPCKKISEAELCAKFTAWAQANSDWIVYAETGGFDMLLVAPDGAQIGIEAKLHCTPKVIEQALPQDYFDGAPGADYRGVLLPHAPEAKFGEKLRLLGLLSFYGSRHDDLFHGASLADRTGWSHWVPAQRIELPAYLPDVPAGAPAPVRLTKWKVAALKIVALIEVRGYVTPQDFRELGIDVRRWRDPANELLRLDAAGRWVRGEKLNFDGQHPRVFAEILEAIRREVGEALDGSRKPKET